MRRSEVATWATFLRSFGRREPMVALAKTGNRMTHGIWWSLRNWKYRRRVLDTEAEAKQKFSEEPIQSMVRNGIGRETLEERALSLTDSDGVVSLLYCLAFVSDLPDVSVRLLTRMLEGSEATVLHRLDGQKIRKFVPLLSSLGSETRQGLLQWIDPTLIAVLKPDLPKGEYDKWLRRWSDKELTAAEKDHDPATIAHVWSKSSDARSIIVDRANALVNDAPWKALLYVLALARADSCQGTELLSRLLALEEGGITWHSLDPAEAKTLFSFAYRHSQKLLEPIAAKLDDELFVRARPEQDDPALDAWLRLALRREALWHVAAVELPELSLAFPEPEDIVRIHGCETSEPAVRSLQQTLQQALADGNAGAPRIELLLRQLNTLFYRYALEPDEQLLRSLAEKLERLPIPALTFAAAIMRRKPAAAIQSALGLVWCRIVAEALIQPDHPTRTISAKLCLAADEVAAAMGACAACDADYRGFDADEKLFQPINQLRQKMSLLLRKKYELLDRREELEAKNVRQLPKVALRNVLEAWPNELRSCYTEIGAVNDQLEKLRRRIEEKIHVARSHCSPGYLLLDTLRWGQEVAVEVRQAAAWGLDVLQLEGNLNEAARQTMRTAISTAVDAYGSTFREKRIHAPVQSSRTELLERIEKDLSWMNRIGTASEAGAPCTPDPGPSPPGVAGTPLRDLVDMMCEWVPAAVKFLERYPLRLMIPDDRGRLAEYLKNGAHIQLWTLHLPPLNTGMVKKRFLELDDRSLPNSMGIDYRLFRHAFLLIPILYHEYLHHAGVPENDNSPIPNETEVRIREFLFARGFVAALAPKDDRDLPAYERSLLDAIREIGHYDLLWDLLLEFAEPESLEFLNQVIAKVYGGGLDRKRAEQQANQEIDELNADIKSKNHGLTWDAWIRWPLLRSQDAGQITSDFRDILLRHASQVNTVEASALDTILEGESSCSYRQGWDAYLRREGSLTELHPALLEYTQQTSELSSQRGSPGGADNDPDAAENGGSRREHADGSGGADET